MRISDKILILITLLFPFGCSTFDQNVSTNDFITVDNTKFILNEKPYYFVGTNLWYGAYLGAEFNHGDRERLILELDKLKSLNITNLRILASSEKSTIKRSIEPTFQNDLGEYNENLFIGLDFLLNEMSKRKMYAILYLNNYWEWSGGMGQYNGWTKNENPPDLGDQNTDWQEWNNYINSFYKNEEANKYYKDYIEHIVKRKNTFSDQYYSEDPTIMSWQLANEPRPGNGEDGFKNVNYFYDWINKTSEFVKSLDSNHLVCLGSEGIFGSLESEAVYIEANKFINIDYLNFHIWPKNWGWFDAENAEATFDSTLIKTINYFNRHLDLASTLSKPITLEEFGLSRDNEIYLRGTPTLYRNKYFKSIFDSITQNIKNGNPIAGSNFWSWGGDGFKKSRDAIWKFGDPYTGDPPQEPQGLNSVFNTDYETLKIIKAHGEELKLLIQ